MTVKKYLYQGEEFKIDDSKGCYLEVTYQEEIGYAGVWVQGTKESPYGYSTGSGSVTDKGLKSGNLGIATIELALDSLCRQLISNHQRNEGRKAFKPEEACEALHGFVQKL